MKIRLVQKIQKVFLEIKRKLKRTVSFLPWKSEKNKNGVLFRPLVETWGRWFYLKSSEKQKSPSTLNRFVQPTTSGLCLLQAIIRPFSWHFSDSCPPVVWPPITIKLSRFQTTPWLLLAIWRSPILLHLSSSAEYEAITEE